MTAANNSEKRTYGVQVKLANEEMGELHTLTHGTLSIVLDALWGGAMLPDLKIGHAEMAEDDDGVIFFERLT